MELLSPGREDCLWTRAQSRSVCSGAFWFSIDSSFFLRCCHFPIAKFSIVERPNASHDKLWSRKRLIRLFTHMFLPSSIGFRSLLIGPSNTFKRGWKGLEVLTSNQERQGFLTLRRACFSEVSLLALLYLFMYGRKDKKQSKQLKKPISVTESLETHIVRKHSKKASFCAKQSLQLNYSISLRLLEMRSKRKTNELQQKRKKKI